MKTKPLLATLVVVMGLAQPALADSSGVWGCQARLVVRPTHVEATVIRVWNFSDRRDVLLEEINIFGNDGVQLPLGPRAPVLPVQIGPHQQTALIVQNLLDVPLPLPPTFTMFGIQVIVKWRTNSGGEPLAEVSWNVSHRDPVTPELMTLVSTDTRKCYDLK